VTDDAAMDFMKWLSSLDEILYEVMSWIVFFPVTLWRALRRPLAMMDYADRQLGLPETEQYADTLSPPLFLALALIIAHGLGAALGETDGLIANQHGLGGMISTDVSALALRVIVFSAFPLLAAVRLVRRRGLVLDRATLRLPFYAQCYPAAIFALGLSLGTTLAITPWPALRVAGGILAGLALLYNVVVGMRWFSAQLGIGWPSALGAAMLSLVEGFVFLMIAAFLFAR
jgi:hypothetical protein